MTDEETPGRTGWVVVVGTGSFSSCYGVFGSYEDCVAWRKAEGFAGADAEIRPIRAYRARQPAEAEPPRTG